MVIHNGRVSGSHEAADNVAAHPAKADHSQLHLQSPIAVRFSGSTLRSELIRDAKRKIDLNPSFFERDESGSSTRTSSSSKPSS
jgi:hypothetical protein